MSLATRALRRSTKECSGSSREMAASSRSSSSPLERRETLVT